MMCQFRQLLGIFEELFSLLGRVRPKLRQRPFITVFGRPSFRGGPETKFQQLQPIAVPKGAPYSTILCFSAVYVPTMFLRILKLLGARVVINQNGVYYPSWYGPRYRRRNSYLRRLNALADHSFFQSHFALQSYRDWVGPPPARHSVLHNAVDLGVFFPDFSRIREGAPRVLVFTDVSEFTHSVWRHVLGFISYMNSRPLPGGVRWVGVGRIHSRKVFEELGLEGWIKSSGTEFEFHQNLSKNEIPTLLRGCDVGIHLVYNDVCPNKVLEALASGVWVIGTASGGTPEVIGEGGKALKVPVGYGSPRFPPHEEIRGAILDYLAARGECTKAARRQAEKFDIETWYRALEQV